MQQTNMKLEKERDLGEIITDTFSFLRINYKPLYQVFVSTILPIMLLFVAANAYYQYATQEITTNSLFLNNDPFGLFKNLSSILIPTILALLTSLFFYVISSIAILGSVKSYQQTGEIDVKFVKAEIKSRFWSMTGLVLLSFIVLVLGLMICIVPFFYLIVPVTMMFPILIFENKNVGDSFSDAFNLIKENFWPTLGTIIVVFLIIMFASGIFQIPIILYSLFSMVTQLEASYENLDNLVKVDWVLIGLSAIGTFGSNILSLVSIISWALIYFNLNEKHNLTGTVQEIDSIGGN